MQIDRIIDNKRLYEERFEENNAVIAGVLTAVDYPKSAEVKAMKGFYWIRPLGQPEAPPVPVINNNKVAPIPELRVLYRRGPKAPYDFEIVGHDNSLAYYPGYTNASTIPYHAREHEPGGLQPINVYLRAITPLRADVTGTGFNVTIAPANITTRSGVRTFPGVTDYDLSAYVPSSGQVVVVLLYILEDMSLNDATGTSTLDNPLIPYNYPALPANALPVCYIGLRGGASVLVETDIITDARALFTVPISPLDGGTYEAGYDATSPVDFTSINADEVLTKISVENLIAFEDPEATIMIGTLADPSLLFDTGDTILSEWDTIFIKNFSIDGPFTLRLTINSGYSSYGLIKVAYSVVKKGVS